MCLWASMNPGMALIPLASIAFRPCVLAEPALTETILPASTIMLQDGMTAPLPTG